MAHDDHKNSGSTSTAGTRSRDESGAPQGSADSASGPGFPVIGIGASAGGLEALEEVFGDLSVDAGMAYLVAQHLDPDHMSNLDVILGRTTSMPIETMSDGQVLEKNHVYLLPRDGVAHLVGDRFRITERPQRSAGAATVIDELFCSLAESVGRNSVGVVLSGMGADGTAGIKAIHEAGGVTFAQSFDTAKYDSMPRTAAASGYIDRVLPAPEIAQELNSLSQHPAWSRPSHGEEPEFRDDETELYDRVIKLLKRHTGIDLNYYKKATIERRLFRRMVLLRIESLKEYVAYLEAHPEELRSLSEDALIKVTSFFRDRESFESLKESAIPKIVQRRDLEDSIRVWVPGCSTGEEAYSLAMVLLEYLSDEGLNLDVQIFATDISENAINTAREGYYPEHIKEQVSEGRLKRFFTQTGAGYQVSKSVRSMCVFARQDVVNDPPFSRLDLISCRNLLIYFSSALQKKVVPTLHYALKPDAFLFLGSSESVSGFGNLFAVESKKHHLYRRLQGHSLGAGNMAGAELYDSRPQSPYPETKRRGQTEEKEIARWADQVLLSRFAQAGFVIDDKYHILQFRGDTNRFLNISAGAPNYNLLKIANRELQRPIRDLVEKTKSSGHAEVAADASFTTNESTDSVGIQVIPLRIRSELGRYFLVVMRQGAQAAAEASAAAKPPPAAAKPPPAAAISDAEKRDEITRLEAELNEAREQLQAMSEEYETTTEELKSSNEEILSSNEELQSTNEELQTAKEEVQSSNEELRTLNEELGNRNTQLGRINDDLANLLRSIRIPVLMLSDELKIRRFTPEATRLFKIVPTDVGRPIEDIKASFDTASLQAMARQVIETMQLREAQVKTKDGYWYTVQIRPYQTSDRRIDGVVASFLDIHAVKTSTDQSALLFAEDIVDTVKEPLVVLDEGLRIQTANSSFFKTFGGNIDEFAGRRLTEVHGGVWAVSGLEDRLRRIVPEESSFEDFEVSKRFAQAGERTLLLNAREIYRSHTRTNLILLGIQDVTEHVKRKKLELEKETAEAANQAKTNFLAHVSHEIRTPLSSISGFTELLQKENLEAQKQLEYLALIKRNSKHLTELINDILDLSKIEAGEIALESATFPLASELKTVFAALDARAAGSDVDLELFYETPMPEVVVGDPTKFRQILINIVGNALKFTERGHVRVKAQSEEGSADGQVRLRLTVEDTGQGIPPDKQEHVFEPFSQADASTTRVYGGTGLGLTLARRLAVYMGGDVRLVSSKPGEGSTFEVFVTLGLPPGTRFIERPKGEASMTSEQPPDRDALQGKRVLVVEDGEDNRILINTVLESAGAEVTLTESGEAAVELTSRSPFDAVLMDVQLPVMDGYEATRKIRELGYKGPVIALTAHALSEDRSRCMEAGCDDYCSKPFSPDGLVQVVGKWASKT